MVATLAADWLRDRVLKVRTQELFDGLLRNHLLPTFGAVSLSGIDEAAVRNCGKTVCSPTASPLAGSAR